MMKYSLLLALGLTLFLNGCTLLRLQQETEIIDAMADIEGVIIDPFNNDDPVVLVVIKVDDNPQKHKIVADSILYQDRHFKFRLPPGDYFLLAFHDANGDEVFQNNEKVGWYGADVETFSVTGRGHADKKKMAVVMRTFEASKALLPQLYAASTPEITLQSSKISFGEITTIDAPQFTRENAHMGLWEPLRFAQSVQSGVFFLEPYSTAKIPVIFIHGVSGHPGNWSYLVDNLDRRYFQPWLFYYPSGFRLEPLGQWLGEHLIRLKGRYNFKKAYLVAHSMGGLVSQAAINDLQDKGHDGLVQLFISLSTPWSGHPLAQKGLNLSPVVIPNWYDMNPDSSFLRQLFERPLSGQFQFHLMFSYQGSKGLFEKSNSDGVITLKSQLRQEAQDSAKHIYGFDENHTSILQSPEVSKRLNRLMNDHRKNNHE